MKTLATLSTLVITALSFTAFALEYADADSNASKTSKSYINTPTMEWGNPQDAETISVAKLKISPHQLFAAPEMVWGKPEDFDPKAANRLKQLPLVPAPAMVWGEPADADSATESL